MTKGVTPGDFWRFANKDVEVAKLCYASKNYNNVVFHMQQAYEKTAKGILLVTFLTEEGKDNFKRSFDKNLFEQSALQEIICLNLDFIKGYNHNWHKKLIEVIEIFRKALTNCENDKLPFFGFSEKEKEDLLVELKKFKEFSKSKKSIKDALSKANDLSLKEQQYHSSSPVGGDFNAFLELLELAYVGSVLNDFENSSRYPDLKVGLEYFNLNMSIIENFEQIRKLLTTHLPRFN